VNEVVLLVFPPQLVVVEEPKERGMRFRYECEGRSAGSILGTSSTETNKTQPAIEVDALHHRFPGDQRPPHRPHPTALWHSKCPNTFFPLSFCSYANLGIQCVRRKEIILCFSSRLILCFFFPHCSAGHSKGIEDMDMNAVRLCFQCELEWDDGRKDSLSPVISNPIYDKKATTTSQLKITCLNLNRGSCAGKTEIYMLCDKVQKGKRCNFSSQCTDTSSAVTTVDKCNAFGVQ
uniref:V-rel avian reticuloendotheliosis viral oncogene homolog B n=1 Tax=Labrus bergylta TaxID=56723 RepID=A0A3Q3ERZ6_9LABR